MIESPHALAYQLLVSDGDRSAVLDRYVRHAVLERLADPPSKAVLTRFHSHYKTQRGSSDEKDLVKFAKDGTFPRTVKQRGHPGLETLQRLKLVDKVNATG